VLHAALLCASLLAAPSGDPPAPSGDIKTYEALKAKAGKDASAQVKLALWCEAHGLDAERMKHLALAVLSDPKSATARGLMGMVAFDGRWDSAEKIGERIKADDQRAARMAEYEGRRSKLADKEARIKNDEDRAKAGGQTDLAYLVRINGNHHLARIHAELGLWCEQNGLKPEALAHFTTSLHFDPYREATWRHLGCVKHNGRWMVAEQAAAEERNEHEQRTANRHWEPLLKKWKTWLGDGSTSHRAEARERLAAVTDPRAVPLIVKFFGADSSEAGQTFLVQLLGQIDDPRSSIALADLAVRTRSESVRWPAIEILKKRPRRDYAGHLVEMVHAKIRYEVLQPVGGPGTTGSLVLETPRLRIIRKYTSPVAFRVTSQFYGYVGYDGNGLPVVVQGKEMNRALVDPGKLHEIEARTAELILEANLKSQAVQQRMSADINEIEMTNQQIVADNAQVLPVLQLAADTPKDLKGDDEEKLNAWWFDKVGYSYQSPPQVTLVQDATPQYRPPVITSCFVAGTPVRTLDGPKPIEAIQVGDQVLGQDGATGVLSFQSVVFVHRNAPGKTLRVSLSDGESVVCSVYHRFWRANLGWAMALELKAGDTLRKLGGVVRVEKVEADTIRPLYNLDVAGTRSFFVGASNLLVHDNTLPDHRLKPFDALPVVEASPLR
jgi:hypothetical protein